MNTKNTILFWISTIAIALLSIILSFYTTNTTITTTTITLPTFEVTFINSIIEQSGIYDLFSFINEISGRHHRHHHHHHRRRKTTCDTNAWKNSRLVSEYAVQLVLTVDQKGCGNFTTLQQAVDVVPDSSQSTTLIILNSGTYRYLIIFLHDHAIFSKKFYMFNVIYKCVQILKKWHIFKMFKASKLQESFIVVTGKRFRWIKPRPIW